MSGGTIRIHIDDPQDGSLTCAHCHLPHRVPLATQRHFEDKAAGLGADVRQIWECGACYLAHARHVGAKFPHGRVRTDCTHTVPPFTEGD